jgi:predicted nucleic acid-binding Zn ribbon protein
VSGDDEQQPVDPASALLARARQGAAARPRPRPARRRSEQPELSGAGPDQRDPQRLGAAVRELVGDRSWSDTLAAASVVARWDEIVGADVAAHCRPSRLEGGELTVVAESTAWATQIRLLSRQLLDRIAAEAGRGVVRTIRVHGPTAPDWRHGPRRVSGGRGPRDTYG